MVARGAFFGGVEPGWARQEASHHTGPFPEPNCLQKPWLTGAAASRCLLELLASD